MPRAIDIADWTVRRAGGLVHVHASLTGNSVRLYECEETGAGIGRDCVEMSSDMLRAIVERMDAARVDDDRQRSMAV